MTFREYRSNVVSGLSQFVNSILGGYPCETLSARVFRNDRFIYKVIDFLFFWEDSHCRNALVSDVVDSEFFLSDASEVLELDLDWIFLEEAVSPEPEKIKDVVEEKAKDTGKVKVPSAPEKSPKTPSTNGMSEDGGQKFSGK